MEVGIPGASFPSLTLTGPSFVQDLLPVYGASGPLAGDETNPGFTTSGEFGGDVLALQLNVDFSDAGFVTGTAGIPPRN